MQPDPFRAFAGAPTIPLPLLADDRFQSLYHFTVGGPVDDPRLTTLPPYAHLTRAARRA
jgi:hypothetical protein